MPAISFPVTADEKDKKTGTIPKDHARPYFRLGSLRTYCAAWPLPCPLPLPRTGMVAPVLTQIFY